MKEWRNCHSRGESQNLVFQYFLVPLAKNFTCIWECATRLFTVTSSLGLSYQYFNQVTIQKERERFWNFSFVWKLEETPCVLVGSWQKGHKKTCVYERHSDLTDAPKGVTFKTHPNINSVTPSPKTPLGFHAVKCAMVVQNGQWRCVPIITSMANINGGYKA